MADSDFFTDFNKQLTVEEGRILLQFKKCDYNLQFAFPNQTCKKIPKTAQKQSFKQRIKIKAVYGIIQMEINNYLVAVTKASLIGQIFGRKIFQAQKMDFFCLAKQQNQKDKIYIKGLSQIFNNKYWYFSDQYDLTNSLQQFVSNGNSMRNKRMQFMYNAEWIDDFVKLKAYQWITGFISGYIHIGLIQAGSNAFQGCLVTRRDKRRQGKRWIVRGADLDGNCVNTAQTEMILQTVYQQKRHVFSYVQLRGSMPFIWKQTPDLGWSPKVTINTNDKLNTQVMKKTYEDIKRTYQSCSLLNLIDKKGQQKKLGQYLDKTHRSLQQNQIKLVWFDFHAQCKNMKYQNLSKLLDIVKHELDNYGYFYIQTSKQKQSSLQKTERPTKKNVQKGVFRTNCMDCLDRTNVVQSVIARQVLISWLGKLGIINKSRNTSAFQRLPDDLEEFFRAQWTNNANVVSLLYSGTPAMKTDFTATGKRTTKGALNDGVYSIKRYCFGNFYDSYDQDFIDFSLGKLRPKSSKHQVIRHSSFNSLYLLIILALIVISMIGLLIDSTLNNDSWNLGYKIPASILGAGLVLFIAKQMKGVVLRQPIKAEKLC